MDDAAAVQLVFTFADRAPEEVIVAVAGCAGPIAPGRSRRRMTADLRADLAALSPPDWRAYLSP